MKRFLTAIFLGLSGMAAVSSGLEISRMRVESLEAPLGIHESAPRLSWELSSPQRGARQTAYQILVASEKGLLVAGKADLWDSDRVESAETTQLAYAGKALVSNQHVWWQVTSWDEAGKSFASPISEWSMGLLKLEDWTAEWIGLSGPKPESGSFPKDSHWIWLDDAKSLTGVFRKSFDIDALPEHARLMATADNSFTLWINGRHVMTGDSFKEGHLLDIAPHLLKGRNVIVVEVRNEEAGPAGLLLSLEIPGKGLVSDASGRTAPGSPTFREKPDFDDSAWKPAVDLGEAGVAPWGDVTWTSQDRILPATLLRRDFTVGKAISRATLHVVGLGYHEAYLNGQKISDHVLDPSLTDYDHRLPVVTHDVTALMKQGGNAIGIQLGNGRYYAPRTNIPTATKSYGWPVARAQLMIDYSDGSSEVVATEPSWKATDQGPVRANNDYDGEIYDARMEQAGWTAAGFDASKWKDAELIPVPAGKLVPTLIPPIRVTETRKAASLKEVKPGVWVYDFGQNLTGWCRLHVKGPEGKAVRIRFAETLADDGSLYTVNLRGAQVLDRYTLKGTASGETWEPRFTYHGFRYAEVTGFPGTPAIDSLEARVVGSDLPMVGTFVSSNPLLDRIISNARWGMRSNYLSIPVDCPQRDERQGWQGDRAAEARGETFLFDVSSFYAKWLDDIRDSQHPDGNVSDVCPAYWPFYSGSAVWPAVQTIMPETLYLKYGDRRTLERQYDGTRKWLEFILARRDKDGLLPPDPYGDWCAPPERKDIIHSSSPEVVTDKAFVSNAYLAKQLSLMAWSAGVLGKSDEAQRWQTEFEKTRASIQSRFWKDDTLANGTQTSYALGLSFDLIPLVARTAFSNRFIDRIQTKDHSHIGTGLIGGQWLHTSLDGIGRSDLALTMATQTDYPGIGYMVDHGATTIWELWNGNTADPAMNSGNHVMLLGDLVTWCFERLAGIQTDPQIPGYGQIVLSPSVPAGLTHVEATHRTPHGWVKSSWTNRDGKFIWDVEIPANTKAIVDFQSLGKGADLKVTESSKPIDGLNVIQSISAVHQNSARKYLVPSGRYHFEAN